MPLTKLSMGSWIEGEDGVGAGEPTCIVSVSYSPHPSAVRGIRLYVEEDPTARSLWHRKE